MTHARKSVALAALVCAFGFGLTGCGGGGDDNNDTPTPASRNAAEGFWCVVDSDGVMDQLIMLDNGAVWGMYGSGSCGSGYTSIDGMIHGSYTTSGTSFSAPLTKFDYDDLVPYSLSLSGTASAQNALHIVTNNGTAFDIDYLSVYDQPASLTSLASQYAGVSATTAGSGSVLQTSMVIAGSNIIMPADANGCSASGTMTPHSTSHGTVGVFDLSLTFSGASCPLNDPLTDGTTVNGIAIRQAYGNLLQIMTATPNGSKDFFFLGGGQ